MNFTSSFFLIGLLPIFILLCYLLRHKKYSRKILLFAANCIFYVWGGLGAFLYLCCFTVVVWLVCLAVYKSKANTKNIEISTVKMISGGGIALVCIPLLIVKYLSFFISGINKFIGFQLDPPDILVPLGISFFTFEAVSLICDICSGKIQKFVPIWDVFLYLSFFPTVTSGPILRYSDFQNGLTDKIDISLYGEAFERIAVGLCKKVLIADKIAPLADYYFNGVAAGNTYSTLGLWIGSFAYSLQIYFDFSGYSDMAIGIGKLLGFHIPENFNKPYQAGSISDFWRRWHISLSQWFRDYVYIPLGGNRCFALRHVFNLLIVWFLTGLWHGADWTFIIWGLGYFVLLTIEKYTPFFKKIGEKWYGHIYALFFINFLWIPFRANNIDTMARYIAGSFGFGKNGSLEEMAIHFIPFLIVAILLCCPWISIFERILKNIGDRKWFRIGKGVLLILFTGIAVCAVINSSYTPYIYGGF